jgi:hypothetical protein
MQWPVGFSAFGAICGLEIRNLGIMAFLLTAQSQRLEAVSF